MGLPALDLLRLLSCILTHTPHTLPTTSVARIKVSHTHQDVVNSLMLGWVRTGVGTANRRMESGRFLQESSGRPCTDGGGNF